MRAIADTLSRAVIFDLFGVITSEVAPYWLAEHFPAHEAIEIKATLVHSADLGDITEADMFSHLADLSGIPSDRIALQWRSYVRVDEAVLELLRSLRSDYRLGLLTNATSDFVRRILEENHLSDLFDAIVVSSEARVAKPSPQAYELILSRLRARPSDAVMIDDNPVNVKAAVDLGMQGILFQGVDDLRAALAGPKASPL